jgi:catechol 2,3-dioxygenase-like lactoylglutathione lyase family enzyme
LPRRMFLALGGSALVAPPVLAEIPAQLDHIVLGCRDLDRGITFVEEGTGVRAALGGVHPGAGTHNALLSLGERRYLEILAPDPGQPDAGNPLEKLSEPRLMTWAVRPGDLATFARKLRRSNIAFEGPRPGKRQRPDGLVLKWQALGLSDNVSGMLPFFIEWSTDSVHPSEDSPKGCSLVRFEASTPDPDALTKQATLLGLDLHVIRGDRPQLRATIAGLTGQLTISS